MATIYYDRDADLSLIRAKKVGIVGYGSQGHAHALNLRESGVDVRVGLHPTSRRAAAAKAAGLTVSTVDEVAAWCDVLMILAPDTAQPKIWRDQVAPHFEGKAPGAKTLMFAHGFNIHYKTIAPSASIDLGLVAPKAPGHRVRETYQEGGGVPALLAVGPDARPGVHALVLSYAAAIGSARAGVLETTFAEETETDLFGEQAVLCGGASALVQAGFETLVNAGYQPEVAYFECLHELKLIVDLMYRGGLKYMRYSVSDTAEWGDYVAGHKVIGDASRKAMGELLAAIRSGEFAREWIAENEAGRPKFLETRRREAEHPIELVGARLRKMMPFLDPVDVDPEGGQP
ncbi:MAG: ketol-acid reductoisomerase [Kofleriaceae bacterium]|nr:ketol-acid reductoisomerase [Myxococcales bacterium]MCB9563233.1 ketol-acid reductoisomerase [Kofleriaceae bacterium]MCB9573585.1 ketol-acid reductoisomerase [Kofleriaceae bacterium]